jgi:hypothetical protein
LGKGVIAETVVTDADTQTVLVNFRNENGMLGTLSLSPGNRRAKNLTYKLGDQKVWIQSIELGSSAYDMKNGSVVINSKVSDNTGYNKVAYKGLIADW